MRVSFASFVLNLLNGLGAEHDATASGSYRPGSVVPIEVGDASRSLRVQTPGGDTMPLPVNALGKADFVATEELGVYKVLAGGGTVRQFAVNLADPAESDIRLSATPSIKIGYVEVDGKSEWRAGHFEIWKELLLIGLAVLVLEWYTYLRRVYYQ
jgi:hypothetical protein